MQIEKLRDLMIDAVNKSIGDEKKVAIAFSGGVDSTTIAKIAMNKCSVDLITIGVENSPDLIASEQCAKEMGLKLYKIIVDEHMIYQSYEKCWNIKNGTMVDIELMSVIYYICKKAKELGNKKILFGSGAEELFIGYKKYYNAYNEGKNLETILRKEIETLPQRDIKRTNLVAQTFGLKAKTPFMDNELIYEVFSVPLEKRMGPVEMKKPIIRKIAKMLDVPELAVRRQKKAMQYGSNIHKIVLKLAKEKKIKMLDPRPPFVYDD